MKKKAIKQTGMVVRRETRADMADAWVRKIAQEEIKKETGQIITQISRELKALRLDLEILERRSGNFTGMTEAETSDLVCSLVKARLSYQTIQDLVDQVLRSFYGPRPMEHPSFRQRLGISKDHVEWWKSKSDSSV